MQVLVNTDNTITGREELEKQVRSTVENKLGRFSDHVTRIEVHLGDENSHKGGDRDQRCTMEARVEGLQPTAVTAHSDTVMKAVDAAVGKLRSALDTTLGKRAEHR